MEGWNRRGETGGVGKNPELAHTRNIPLPCCCTWPTTGRVLQLPSHALLMAHNHFC